MRYGGAERHVGDVSQPGSEHRLRVPRQRREQCGARDERRRFVDHAAGAAERAHRGRHRPDERTPEVDGLRRRRDEFSDSVSRGRRRSLDGPRHGGAGQRRVGLGGRSRRRRDLRIPGAGEALDERAVDAEQRRVGGYAGTARRSGVADRPDPRFDHRPSGLARQGLGGTLVRRGVPAGNERLAGLRADRTGHALLARVRLDAGRDLRVPGAGRERGRFVALERRGPRDPAAGAADRPHGTMGGGFRNPFPGLDRQLGWRDGVRPSASAP